MKKYIVYVLLLSMVLAMLPFGVLATETEAVTREPGKCGENLSWSYSGGTLTISGSGAMDDFQEGGAPWQEHKDSIEKVVFSGDVTSVGSFAFKEYDRLSEVYFGESMHTIGEQAFKNCDVLRSVILPASFRRFGKECFMGCKQLLEVWCKGGMPSFNGNCLWDTGATVYYPPNNAWPVDAVWQVLSSYRNKIIIQGGYAPEQEEPVEIQPAATEAAVEAVVVETEPAVTEAVVETVPETTAAATEAPVEATSAPETEPAPTQEETKPAWMEEMERLEQEQETVKEEPEERQSIGIGLVVGLCILIVILLLILIGALVFRRRQY